MAETSKRELGMKEIAGACLLVLLAGAVPNRAGHAGDAPSASEKRHGKMMALSIRIAQAEGNEGKIKKYKSLARQQRARKKPPTPLSPPGTRVSRPGRTP